MRKLQDKEDFEHDTSITDDQIKARVKHCLTFMMMGGLRASLFEDTPEEDFNAMVEAAVLPAWLSRQSVAIEAIAEWREVHAWLKDLPDKTGL